VKSQFRYFRYMCAQRQTSIYSPLLLVLKQLEHHKA